MPAPNALKYATQLLLNTCLSQQLQAAVNTKKGAMKKTRERKLAMGFGGSHRQKENKAHFYPTLLLKNCKKLGKT